MELFAGDGQIPNPDGFPQPIAPFPEPTDLLHGLPKAGINSPNIINHRPSSPPQKLRPIRSGAGLFGTLETGFPSCQAGSYDGEFECEQKVDGGACGNASVAASDPIGVGSGALVEGWGTNGVEGGLEKESRFFSVLGSSSDDGVDNLAIDFRGPANRKRRRKSRRSSVEHFLESLVMEVMEKQEEMHKQLIEMIEKMEKERLMREEAWKQLEIERHRRDEVVRAEEMSRNLALISFLQNMLGEEEIQIPEPGAQQSVEENGVETNSETDKECNPNNKTRWPEVEVQALIALRTSLEHKFRVSGSKGSIWEEISVGMHRMGYNRTSKKCKEKWENINKYFKKLTESGKRQLSNGKNCQYFHNLDLLYRNGLLNPGVGGGIANIDGDNVSSERDSESL